MSAVFLVKDRVSAISLHYFLWGVAFLRLAVSSINTVYWWNYALYGEEKVLLDQLSYVLFAVSEAGKTSLKIV